MLHIRMLRILYVRILRILEFSVGTVHQAC